MKIGIPLFGQSVSPHFSTAPEVLVVLTHGRRVSSTSKFSFSRLSLVGKRRKLIGMGIETLICGGIDGTTKGWFEERGIRVIDNTMGEAMEVLRRFLSEQTGDGLRGSRPVTGGRGHDNARRNTPKPV